jgi:hypothetical protein
VEDPMADDTGEDLEEVVDEEETEEPEEGTEETPPKEPLKGEAKRLADLQSKADKAEARANKAEKALAAAQKASSNSGSADPQTLALMQELREASLDAVFGEYPELKEYGIDRSLIEGSNRAQMREAATSLVGLIKSVSTKTRNKVLQENGIKAEPAGNTRKPPADYESMSDEDFEKLLNSVQ